jgi:hypothetical protein
MSSPPAAFEGLHEAISEMPPSSPPLQASTMGSRKPMKPPPITPKRFTRFFTPRNSTHGSSHTRSIGNSGRQLQDITRSALNRCSNANRKTTPRKTVNFADEMPTQVSTPQVNRLKRKTPYLSPESSPMQSSPSKRSRYVTPPPFTILEDEPPTFEVPRQYPAPIRRLKSLGSTSRILQRSFGGSLGIGRGSARDHGASWQDQTSNFYSSADDFHQLPQGAPPFCSASCNSKSIFSL